MHYLFNGQSNKWSYCLLSGRYKKTFCFLCLKSSIYQKTSLPLLFYHIFSMPITLQSCSHLITYLIFRNVVKWYAQKQKNPVTRYWLEITIIVWEHIPTLQFKLDKDFYRGFPYFISISILIDIKLDKSLKMPETKDFYCSLRPIFFVATPRTQHVVSEGTYREAESIWCDTAFEAHWDF